MSKRQRVKTVRRPPRLGASRRLRSQDTSSAAVVHSPGHGVPEAQVYRDMVEHLPAGAVFVDGDLLVLNQAAEALTGYTRTEIRTKNDWFKRLFGAERAKIRKLYERYREDHFPTPSPPLTITRKDGGVRVIQAAGYRFDDHEIWLLDDRTDRLRAEVELKKREEHLRSIVNSATDAIVTMDPKGTIGSFNPAAERIFGYTASEVIGQNVRILMPSPYRDEHDGYLARYMKTREPRIIGRGREVTGRRRDGTVFPIDLAVSEARESRIFTGIIRDISERKMLERRLADSQSEERAALARELHDGVGGLLTGISMLAQTLQARLSKTTPALAPRAESLVSHIEDAQAQIRRVVRGLMPVESVPEGLMVALQQLADSCRSMHRISCRFLCSRPVYFDEQLVAGNLFRIAQEAVSNALRHSKATHLTIRLSRSNQHTVLEIADDGTGIRRGARTSQGIGLKSMNNRAGLLGGELAITPRAGGGTVVRIRLPHRARNPMET